MAAPKKRRKRRIEEVKVCSKGQLVKANFFILLCTSAESDGRTDGRLKEIKAAFSPSVGMNIQIPSQPPFLLAAKQRWSMDHSDKV